MDAPPPSLKEISPFLKQSEEVAERQPLVAYYLAQYAVERGLAVRNANPTDPTILPFLMSLLDRLEEAKRELKPNPEQGRQQMEVLGLQLFDAADRSTSAEDGAQPTKLTVKQFYAASIILEATRQFGELSDDIATRVQAAKVKAVQVTRQLKAQGASGAPAAAAAPRPAAPPQQPQSAPTPQAPPARPPAPSQQQQPQQPPSAPPTYGVPPPGYGAPPPGYPPMGPPQSQPYSTFTAQPAPASPTAAAAGAAAAPGKPTGFQPYAGPPPSHLVAHQQNGHSGGSSSGGSGSVAASLDTICEAQKFAKFAVSALQFNDVNTAVTNLERALTILRNR